jgi:hypothetical protein
MNLTLDVPMCQERPEEIKRSSIFILGTNTREMINESRILRVVIITTSSLTIWGS